MTIFYLIRHADVQRNTEGKYDNDPGISQLGHEQITKLKQELQNVTFDKTFSSNKYRTIKTALTFFDDNKDVIVCPDFVEAKGPVSDINKDGLSTLEKDDFFTSLSDTQKFSYKPKDGSESLEESYVRTINKMKEVAKENPDSTIAVFTHTLLIRSLLAGIKYITATAVSGNNFFNCRYVILKVDENSNFSVLRETGLSKR